MKGEVERGEWEENEESTVAVSIWVSLSGGSRERRMVRGRMSRR